MSLGNKDVMSQNLKYYISQSGKDRKEIAEELNISYSTFTEWVNGKKYPRIDKIEILANYFQILKSDLIEEKTEQRKKNDALAKIVLKMQSDETFYQAVAILYSLDAEQLLIVKNALSLLDK